MRRWGWQGALLLSVFTSNWWFPCVYRALPPTLWLVFIMVVGVLLALRWVAYLAKKRRD